MFVVLITSKTREEGEETGGERKGTMCLVEVCEVLLVFVTAETPWLELVFRWKHWGRVDECVVCLGVSGV